MRCIKHACRAVKKKGSAEARDQYCVLDFRVTDLMRIHTLVLVSRAESRLYRVTCWKMICLCAVYHLLVSTIHTDAI